LGLQNLKWVHDRDHAPFKGDLSFVARTTYQNRNLYLQPYWYEEDDPVGISPDWHEKTSLWAIVRRCLRDLRFSRLGRTLTCDGQTGRQTGWRTYIRWQHILRWHSVVRWK